MERHKEADQLWGSIYEELTTDIPGKFGAAIGRAEGQVLRLSMVFALLDRSRIIQRRHFEVALALWSYCVDSAQHLFVNSFDHPNAAKIFSALRQAPKGMTRNEIRLVVFQGHPSGAKMEQALGYLRRLKLAYCITEETPGRSAERWFATARAEEEAYA